MSVCALPIRSTKRNSPGSGQKSPHVTPLLLPMIFSPHLECISYSDMILKTTGLFCGGEIPLGPSCIIEWVTVIKQTSPGLGQSWLTSSIFKWSKARPRHLIKSQIKGKCSLFHHQRAWQPRIPLQKAPTRNHKHFSDHLWRWVFIIIINYYYHWPNHSSRQLQNSAERGNQSKWDLENPNAGKTES